MACPLYWTCLKAKSASPQVAVDKIWNALAGDAVDPPFELPDGRSGPVINDWNLIDEESANEQHYGMCDDQTHLMNLALLMQGILSTEYLTYASDDAVVTDKDSKMVGNHKYWLKFDFPPLTGRPDNNYEGSISAAGTYYAVWPKLWQISECWLLRYIGPNGHGADQRWPRTLKRCIP
jgi:hypothetical protein